MEGPYVAHCSLNFSLSISPVLWGDSPNLPARLRASFPRKMTLLPWNGGICHECSRSDLCSRFVLILHCPVVFFPFSYIDDLYVLHRDSGCKSWVLLLSSHIQHHTHGALSSEIDSSSRNEQQPYWFKYSPSSPASDLQSSSFSVIESFVLSILAIGTSEC